MPSPRTPPPFPHAAVRSCAVRWPKDPSRRYPDELHALALACLAADPSARPPLPELVRRARELRGRVPPLLDPPAVAAAARGQQGQQRR